jgi:nucleoside-diphosphate-sugar epimerase
MPTHPRAISHAASLLLTGATGLIGHQVLARLLARGRRVVALVRNGANDLARLESLLAPLGIDVRHDLRRGMLGLLAGDICKGIDALSGPLRGSVDSIIHAAACTRFDADHDGNPHQTNVDGTDRLLAWAEAHDVARLHLLSTAYVCGRGRPENVHSVPETPAARDPVDGFHNAYERSKWRCERLCCDWARQNPARALTILRPSIVVGEYASGRTTRFTGFYLAVRAAEAVAALLHRRDVGGAPPVLRLQGRPEGRQNIVPVDYVADMIAAIACDRRHHGRVYHLVHPSPPSNRLIQQAIEAHFGLRCARFVEVGQIVEERNALERAFDRLAQSVEPYIADTPHFDRAHAMHVERTAGLACPPFDLESLKRLCAFAASVHRPPTVGGARLDSDGPLADPATYFEQFLVRQLPHSKVAQMHRVSATVRFVLHDVPNGQWVCRFERGQLAHVHRGPNTLCEDFGYRTSHAIFARTVAGAADPQQVFLSRQAEIFGDIERGLKMAMVLREFNREFPFPARASGNGREPRLG